VQGRVTCRPPAAIGVKGDFINVPKGGHSQGRSNSPEKLLALGLRFLLETRVTKRGGAKVRGKKTFLAR